MLSDMHTTATFSVSAIDADLCAQLRVRDDAGNAPELLVDTEGGSPLRCCLSVSAPGEPVVLHTGDGLRLEEGGYVEVKAAEEDLVEVRGRDAAAFARLAWHLGNRHLPCAVVTDSAGGTRLLIARDHVIRGHVLSAPSVVTASTHRPG